MVEDKTEYRSEIAHSLNLNDRQRTFTFLCNIFTYGSTTSVSVKKIKKDDLDEKNFLNHFS